MRPEGNARRLLGITRAKAKMWEYRVPISDHIQIVEDPAKLFDIAVGSLGDLSATINGEGYFEKEQLKGLRENLKFASQFFDSYSDSKLNRTLDPFTALCASACFYLCDMPGSSIVLASQQDIATLELEAAGLERLLLWVLQNSNKDLPKNGFSHLPELIERLAHSYVEFRDSGHGQDNIIETANVLQRLSYSMGSPRKLLLADAACAVIRKRLDNSVWTCLPRFSGLPVAAWDEAIRKPRFMRELWPAQRLLGERDVFKGMSAVVQMPTSAGKTKATELIIRSAFLSNRASLAIVVAPFRALCHEIHESLAVAFHGENIGIDELSDVTQEDFHLDLMIAALVSKWQILIVTPEKLQYVLRHDPEFSARIGLIIYDEGHLFDDPQRGVNYELLLSSIKTQLPADSQTVLFSAIIKNPAQVANWLLQNSEAIITGLDLAPTNQSIAFANWTMTLGQLQFPELPNLQDYKFFVPRMLEQHSLSQDGTIFPRKNNPNEIALYLGLKLVENGGVAIFCGRKDSATAILRTAAEIYRKGLAIQPPTGVSNTSEIKRMENIVEQHLGNHSEAKECTTLGILAHHGNIPHGIRLATEYALQQGLAKFVVCTSTLAQGVNLPIRYLIVTSVYQGRERIKTRDFHNLIGRAGRAGKHTEGSIIFADHRIYDQRFNYRDKWRWEQAKELLDPANSEECGSAISEILSPIYSDRGDIHIPIEPLFWAGFYLKTPEQFLEQAETISQEIAGFSVDRVRQQLEEKLVAIRAIQSYLLAHSEEWEGIPQGMNVLVESTLAYSLADDNGRQNLKDLFLLIGENIEAMVQEPAKRRIYGRTLLGLRECVRIDEWVHQKLEVLQCSTNEESLFGMLWPLLRDHIPNRTFRRCNPSDALEPAALGWINGDPFYKIFQDNLQGARIGFGPRPRRVTIDYTVDLCENGFGYHGTLILGAVAEMLNLHEGKFTDLKERLAHLQKRLKYGLPSFKSTMLYELGFADRVISIALTTLANDSATQKHAIIETIRQKQAEIRTMLERYPTYYSMVFERIVA